MKKTSASQSKKTRTVFRLPCFVLLILAVLLLLSIPAETLAKREAANLADGARRSISVSLEPVDSIDILVLGDSESYTSISPMQLYLEHGFSAFDCGQPQQKAEAALSLLSGTLRHQAPKVVLLETNQFFLYEGVVAELRDMLGEAANRLPAIAYHSAWKTLLEPPVQQGNVMYRGFGIRTDIRHSLYLSNYMEMPQPTERIHPITAWHVRRMKALCDREGASLVLYTSVSPAFCNWARHEAVAALADELSVPYWDMNAMTEELGICWETDMLDGGDHVNYYGARRITAWMGAWLADNESLPDHRGEEAYAALDALAQSYAAEAEAALHALEQTHATETDAALDTRVQTCTSETEAVRKQKTTETDVTICR